MPGLPKAVYIILLVLFYIQLVGPGLALDSDDIWDPTSTFTVFLRYFGVLWQGYRSTRIITSLVFSILEFIVEMGQAALTVRFSAKRVASKADSILILLVGKYLRVIFGQMILVGVPAAVKALVDGVDVVLAAIFITFTILDAILYFVDIYLISGRITMEDNPNHEWHASHVFMQVVVQCLGALLSTCLSVANKTGKVVCLALMTLNYCGFGIWCFIKSPLVKRTPTLWLSTMSMTAGLMSLFSLICHFIGKINPAVFLVIFVILVVVCYLIFMAINRGMVSKIMHIMQMCEESPDESDEIMASHWRSAFSFISAIHIVFQHWPPFLLSWRPFYWALEQWPENHELLLLWARIVVLFPKEQDVFRWLLGQYANMKPDFARAVYINQMAHIAGSRIVETSPEILREITRVEKAEEHIRTLHRKLWENILQKNVDSIWGEGGLIFHYTDKLERMFGQLVDSYPNNLDIAKRYCDFLLYIKADMKQYIEWSRKLRQLKHGQHLRLDSAIQAAKNFLPEIQQLCADAFTNTPSDQEKHEPLLSGEKNETADADENEFQVHQMKLGLQNMIERTKVARVWPIILVLVIGTCASIGVFVWYVEVYDKYFVQNVLAKAQFLSVFNGLGNDLITSGLYSVVFPLFNTYDSNAFDIYTDDSLTRELAPTLYPCGNLKPWTFNRTNIDTTTTNVRNQITRLSEAFNNIPESEGLQAIYNAIFIEEVRDGMTLQDVTVKLILNIAELAENPLSYLQYYLNPKFLEMDAIMFNALPIFNEIPPKMVAVHEQDLSNVMQKMNEHLILCIFVVIGFVCIPFVMGQYALTVQSKNISHLFTSLPNTAVREVLENQNKMMVASEEKNVDDHADVDQGQLLTRSFLGVSDVQLVVLVFLSVVMILGGALYLYFSYILRAEETSIDLNRIMLFYKPIYSLGYAMYRLTRGAQMMAVGNESAAFPNISSALIHLMLGNQTLGEIQDIISHDLWGENSAVAIWYESGTHLYRFEDCAPFNDAYQVSPHLEIFEYLCVAEMLEFLDVLVIELQELFRNLAGAWMITHPGGESNPFAPASPPGVKVPLHQTKELPALLFMFTSFGREERFLPFVDLIESSLISKYDKLEGIANNIAVAVCVFQVLILCVLILILMLRGREIRRMLKLFSYVNPAVVLQNSHIVGVLTTGQLKVVEDSHTFKQTEKIIEKMTEGVVLCTRDLDISDMNAAFVRLVGLEPDELRDKRITDIIKNVNTATNSFESVILKVIDALKGNGPTVFMDKVEIEIPNGDERSVLLHVICMTTVGTATENSASKIAAVAMVIQDLTAQKRRDEETRAEQDRRAVMLLRVLPPAIVDEIQQGSETISFAVQSASVACVRVRIIDAAHSDDNLGWRFTFFNQVFKIFDEYLKDYEQLSRVRTFSDTYIYAGGVFGAVNKPDKHAEEATRLALQLIKELPSIQEKTGQKIELVIGLNTGGPLVAGVVSLNRPFFQLIGPASELADQMKETGVPNKLHITRSVYELIYAYNFKVSDRGDVHISNGRTLHTYLVVP